MINFRKGLVRGYKRVFDHVGVIFIEKGLVEKVKEEKKSNEEKRKRKKIRKEKKKKRKKEKRKKVEKEKKKKNNKTRKETITLSKT